MFTFLSRFLPFSFFVSLALYQVHVGVQGGWKECMIAIAADPHGDVDKKCKNGRMNGWTNGGMEWSMQVVNFISVNPLDWSYVSYLFLPF